MTTKIDVAKKILELKSKLQNNEEVNIQSELDDLIAQVLEIEPAYVYISSTTEESIKTEPERAPLPTPDETLKYPYQVRASFSENVE